MASSTGETKEDENPEENLLIEIKTWSKIKDGLDNADADAEEIAARRATEYIDDEMTWNFLIDKSGYVQMDQFREGPQVVISFLNYLHNHKVCPEYEEDMQTALQIAHKAKEELPNCKALAQNAPGKLNKAIYAMPGMRITADFHKLSNGFWYWDYYQPCDDSDDDD
ncbi:hypothetical protein RhiirC2_779846 [Rhizophagus irregularis]|uniref:Uncharacterized protein n=1 Tax=Rhizophagus irregularis TaxID=588596 RepID=A0A2N1N8X1_9GLOM|nr:hypothetical protein RhiirC2_779846 [Rhizophagus irregularis]